VVKEVIRSRLRLGPQTDGFLALFRKVREAMEAQGVCAGVVWSTMTGGRTLVVEREF
jgi:hypothetical protein